MAGKRFDGLTDGAELTDLRRRLVRQDIVVNVVLAAAVGLFAFAAMPPVNVGWQVETRIAAAAGLAAITFGAASVVFVVPEVIWGLLYE